MTDLPPSLDESPAARARAWVVRLASGDITDADMASFKAWLDIPSHRAAFEEARALWLRAEAVEDVFAIRAQPWHRQTGARAGLVGGLLAASLALVVGFDDLKIAAVADYTTPAGGQRTETLPDGSIATLNTDSAIALRFAPGERRVELLRGEAFFEVAHDAARPFRVMAQDGATQAVGTAFAVRDDDNRPNGGLVTVSVAEGTVAITSPEDAGVPTTATLTATAGQRVAYRRGEAPRALAPIAAADAAPWRQGRIVMDGVPFADAIAEIDRYKPGRILLFGDPARYRPVSGVFALDKLDEALAGLAATHGLAATRVTGYLLILR